MKKIIILAAALLFSAAALTAQDNSTPDAEDAYTYDSYGRGDQFLKISLQPVIPLNFGQNLIFGGGAELSYYRFLTPQLALGGEISAIFNATIGGNVLTTIPLTFGATYQFLWDRFEFPLNLGVGICYTSCQNNSYFPGLVVRSGAGAFFRASESWSFGLTVAYMWQPEWTKDDDGNTVYDQGHFLMPTISARYHF